MPRRWEIRQTRSQTSETASCQRDHSKEQRHISKGYLVAY